MVAFFLELAVLALLDPVLSRNPAALPQGFVISFFVLTIMGVTVSAYVMLAYFVEQRARAHRALEAERQRSERLLLKFCPSRSPSDSPNQSPPTPVTWPVDMLFEAPTRSTSPACWQSAQPKLFAVWDQTLRTEAQAAGVRLAPMA